MFTGLLLILILYLTFSNIYNKDSLRVIAENIKNINIIYILICLFIIFLYFILQGLYMKIILRTLNYNISLKKCLFYSLVEFYFSGITPSSTGGQPVQLYYMTKDNIPIRKSYITLMLNTIFFKLIIVILGIVVLIFDSSYALGNAFIYKLFFILGFTFDCILVVIGILLLFKTDFINSTFIKLISFCKKFKIFKHKLEKINTNEVIEKYKDEIDFVKSHNTTVLLTFIITFIQRLLMFSIIYVVYKALGYSSYNYFDLLIIQVSVQVAIEALPLPGGAGLSEGMLHNIFVIIFSLEIADVGMLLTRAFTFYIPLLISGIIIFTQYITMKIKLLKCKN